MINQAGIAYGPELLGYGEIERLFGKDAARGLNSGPVEEPITGFDYLTSRFPNINTLDFNPNVFSSNPTRYATKPAGNYQRFRAIGAGGGIYLRRRIATITKRAGLGA